MTGIKGMKGGGGKREGSGRPAVEDKKKMVPAYLRDAQKAWLVEKYGGITAALESLLPKKLK